MKPIKIDKKDKRILAILDENPNAYLTQIAKTTLCSKQVIEYRLKKLLEQRTIYTFFTQIDPGRLGFALFRVHIKLKNVPEEKYTSFAKSLFENYPTFWVGFVSGSFDIIADIWAKNANSFQNLFSKILDTHKEIINTYEIYSLLEINMYNYCYFVEGISRRRIVLFHHDEAVEIDDTDKKILQEIKSNSRIPYEQISKKVNLSRNAVKARISQLEQSGIIKGYFMMVHFRHFNRLSYKIFIKYNLAKRNQEQRLHNFIQQTPGILALAVLLGKWDLDIEIQPHDAKELQKFIIDLRNKFDIIESYEIIQIIDDYGIDFYPPSLDNHPFLR